MSSTDPFQTAFTLSPHSRACADRAIRLSLGKPWEAGARGPNRFDCWGFILFVLRAAGVTLDDVPYSTLLSRITMFDGGISAAVKSGWHKVPANTAYSVILLGGDDITHIGLYHPSGIVYHCAERVGVVGHSLRSISDIFQRIEWWAK